MTQPTSARCSPGRGLPHRAVQSTLEGQDEIVGQWLDRKDEPGQAEFRWHLLAVTPEVAVVQGETSSPTEGHTCSNLWVIRLDAEGRCAEFAEWWMRHPAPDEPAGLSDPPGGHRNRDRHHGHTACLAAAAPPRGGDRGGPGSVLPVGDRS